MASLISHGVAAPYILHLGLRDYSETWRAMQAYSRERSPASPDQFWLTEHSPTYTLGRGGDEAHVADALACSGIPVVRADRGGQATYHGPGQVILYTLVDLRRRGLGVRSFIGLLEEAVIELLCRYGLTGERRPDLPGANRGVFVGGRKIASIGLHVAGGCCYHGLALNLDMDLRPFERIVVCGNANTAVTQLCDLGVVADPARVGEELARLVFPPTPRNRVRVPPPQVAPNRGIL